MMVVRYRELTEVKHINHWLLPQWSKFQAFKTKPEGFRFGYSFGSRCALLESPKPEWNNCPVIPGCQLIWKAICLNDRDKWPWSCEKKTDATHIFDTSTMKISPLWEIYAYLSNICAKDFYWDRKQNYKDRGKHSSLWYSR